MTLMTTTPIAALVLFDLDGTLVDSAPDLHLAMNRHLDELGLAHVDEAAFRMRVSQGGRAMLRLAIPDADEQRVTDLLPRFLEIYADALAERSGLFDGMQQVLSRISTQGSRWGIVTNKPFELAQKLVSALALDATCAVLIGGDTLPQRKPSPEPLWEACRRCDTDPADAVYVGDDRRDIEAARAAGMPAIAAAWGYRLADDCITAWGADRLAQVPQDLLLPNMLTARSQQT